MEVLVVTGGIGSGKTEACRIIQDAYGCHVYSADSRVKELYYSHPDLVKEIEVALRVRLKGDDGNFVPRLLADVIFNDRTALETVEGIVFPVLSADFEIWMGKHSKDAFVVFESATILEKPYFKGFGDRVIVIDAPFETRLERACKRDSISRETILARMKNQTMMNMISEGRVFPDVDAVICNDGDFHHLEAELIQTVDRLFDIDR